MLRNTSNNYNFYYRTNSAKINDQILEANVISEKWAPLHNFIRVSTTMSNSKYTSRKMARGKDPSDYCQGSNNWTTAVDWHLKVKDIEEDVLLTKNYCITVSLQNISSIHIHSTDFWVLWTKWLCPFLTTPTQKLVKQLLAFLNLHQHAKKSVHSIDLFLSYGQF